MVVVVCGLVALAMAARRATYMGHYDADRLAREALPSPSAVPLFINHVVEAQGAAAAQCVCGGDDDEAPRLSHTHSVSLCLSLSVSLSVSLCVSVYVWV